MNEFPFELSFGPAENAASENEIFVDFHVICHPAGMRSGGGVRYDFVGRVDLGVTDSTHKLSFREFNDACEFLRNNVIGHEKGICTPFGCRKLLYADWTASGRSLRYIENFVCEEVLPLYGNTHTLSNATGSQSTYFRLEARQIIKQYFNANHNDALIFCGSGSTSAMAKFIRIMENAAWNVSTVQKSGNVVRRDEFFSTLR